MISHRACVLFFSYTDNLLLWHPQTVLLQSPGYICPLLYLTLVSQIKCWPGDYGNWQRWVILIKFFLISHLSKGCKLQFASTLLYRFCKIIFQMHICKREEIVALFLLEVTSVWLISLNLNWIIVGFIFSL